MKALSLTQPWATLVAIGAKRFETRSWATAYRGELAIHAAKGFPRDAQALCYTRVFREALMAAGFNHVDELPLGAILSVGRLAQCTSTDAVLTARLVTIDDPEYAFGDYGPKRFALLLEQMRRLSAPISCKGALGLWTVPEAVRALVESA